MVVVLSFLKNVICIFSSYLAAFHIFLLAFLEATGAGFGQMQRWCKGPAPELTMVPALLSGQRVQLWCDAAQTSLIP